MIFKVKIRNIQHINELDYEINLEDNKLHCLIGKNGVGKTTLIKAINNLYSADTYVKTAAPYIFSEASSIHYEVGPEKYDFTFNDKMNLIDTKSIIKNEIKENIFVELPMPYGKRFTHFQRLSSIDEELKSCIAFETYSEPKELKLFLYEIYGNNRFEDLKEFTTKNEKYYFILKENGFYIREDYLSSGEYFVINLYKMIQSRKKIIAIDEIDISLDAHAQVNLIKQLRLFVEEYKINIIFTTHSLPLMKTLNVGELYYIESKGNRTTIKLASYSYVKSLLFGFKGWDKYILTEDKVLMDYLEYIISSKNLSKYNEYKIIHIAGANQVVSLMQRNSEENFFSEERNVLSILDGDQKGMKHVENFDKVLTIPFKSIEKDLYDYYLKGDGSIPRVKDGVLNPIPDDPEKVNRTIRSNGKSLYKELVNPRNKLLSKKEVFDYLNSKEEKEVQELISEISSFLNDY